MRKCSRFSYYIGLLQLVSRMKWDIAFSILLCIWSELWGWNETTDIRYHKNRNYYDNITAQTLAWERGPTRFILCIRVLYSIIEYRYTIVITTSVLNNLCFLYFPVKKYLLVCKSELVAIHWEISRIPGEPIRYCIFE